MSEPSASNIIYRNLSNVSENLIIYKVITSTIFDITLIL